MKEKQYLKEQVPRKIVTYSIYVSKHIIHSYVTTSEQCRSACEQALTRRKFKLRSGGVQDVSQTELTDT